MSVPIAAILQRKGSEVHTIPPTASLADAAGRLAEHGIGALVVSGDGAAVEGILSERDIVRHLADVGAEALQLTVADAMTHQVTTCRKDETADDLMATMTSGRIRHVPVMDEGQLIGIVSIGDVVKSRIDELEMHRESLQEYVTGSGY